MFMNDWNYKLIIKKQFTLKYHKSNDIKTKKKKFVNDIIKRPTQNT